MELQPIRQVSKRFGISPRTLRYYEQIGLISSVKKENSAYRTYDEDTIARLRQIVVLRKLRIPLKQIARILVSGDAKNAIEILEQNLAGIEDEMTALSTIRNMIKSFIEKLNLHEPGFALPDDENLLEILDSLTVTKISFREEKSMEELSKASEKLNRLTDKDVRIVYLPPATVAAYQYIGDEPEMHCHQVMDKFVLESGLIKIKPDTRHFGFNAPNPVDETGYHGYEVWVTIPPDMEVPPPIVKKHFEGGQYAAHMIPFGNFEEWGWLCEWVENHPRYEGNSGSKGQECMWGMLEEHLNFVSHVTKPGAQPEGLQLDLLCPVKERSKQGASH